ncbi:MAG: CAP domain-containing protein [Elusimicrobiota bacterium]
MSTKLSEKIKLMIIPCQENNWRPKLLAGKFLAYFLVFLLFLKIFTFPFLIYFQENIFFADITKSAIVNLINQKRGSLGFQLLKENPALDRAAMLKAQDMMQKGYFSHQSPEGISPWYWFSAAGYQYNIAGENLAIGFLDSAEVYKAWMDSPSHKANILNQNYQDTGIAVLKGDFNGKTTTVVVNLFGKMGTVFQKSAVPQKQEMTPEEKNRNIEVSPQKTADAESLNVVAGESVQGGKTPVAFSLLNFIAVNYYDLIQKIIYLSLVLVIVFLLINIFVRIDIQHPDLILKTLGFVALLLVFSAVDKITFINLIPHNFSIY